MAIFRDIYDGEVISVRLSFMLRRCNFNWDPCCFGIVDHWRGFFSRDILFAIFPTIDPFVMLELYIGFPWILWNIAPEHDCVATPLLLGFMYS